MNEFKTSQEQKKKKNRKAIIFPQNLIHLFHTKYWINLLINNKFLTVETHQSIKIHLNRYYVDIVDESCYLSAY